MKKGFTLIEVIAVLLLVAVLGLVTILGMVPVVDGFAQVRENIVAAQKAHLAMARITREFTTLTNVVSGGETSIIYDYLDSEGNDWRRTLAWNGSGTPVTLNGAVLTDDVAGFRLRYGAAPQSVSSSTWGDGDQLIEMVLITETGGISYTNRIRPRNIGVR